MLYMRVCHYHLNNSYEIVPWISMLKDICAFAEPSTLISKLTAQYNSRFDLSSASRLPLGISACFELAKKAKKGV